MTRSGAHGSARRRSARSVANFFRHAGTSRKLKSGEEVIKQGAQNGCLYLLVMGQLVTTRTAPNEKGTLEEVVAQEHAPGDLVGFESFLLGSVPALGVRAAHFENQDTFKKNVGVEVIELAYARAVELLEHDATLSMHLFHEIAAEMAERIRRRSEGLKSSVLRLGTEAHGFEHETRVQARAPMHIEGSSETPSGCKSPVASLLRDPLAMHPSDSSVMPIVWGRRGGPAMARPIRASHCGPVPAIA